MYQKIDLTRHQIEQMAVYMALNRNIQSVTIEQTNESGIGRSHFAVYHSDHWPQDCTMDITDVSTW